VEVVVGVEVQVILGGCDHSGLKARAESPLTHGFVVLREMVGWRKVA
jgi:hypothetical protein